MMAELDLGHFQVESAVSGLRVHIHSTADLASSEEDIARVRSLLTDHKLNPGSTSLPWTAKGDNMALVLHLRLKGELKATAGEDFVDRLLLQLRNAKLWQQLCFSKPYAQVSRNESDIHRIELRLKHSGETAKRKRKPHKLGIDVPCHDVRPPRGVVHAKLDRVDLHMEVEQTPRKRHRQASSSDTGRRNVKFTVGRPTRNVPELVDDFEVDLEQDYMLGDFPIDDEPNFDFPFELEQRSHCNNIDDEMLLDAFENDKGCAPTPRFATPQTGPLDWQIALLATDDCNSTDNNICELVTMAITTAIAGPRKRRKKGFSVSREDFQSLASIAPSIWSPDYMKAVADRSFFLPTIAHTLAAVSHTSSGTTSNAIDMDILASIAADTHENDDAADLTRLEKLSKALHACLWKKIQRRMYDTRAAKRLDAFGPPSEHHPTNLMFSDDMLKATEQPNYCLYAGDGDIFSDFDLDVDDDRFRYNDGADEDDEWFRSDDDSDNALLDPTHFEVKSAEPHLHRAEGMLGNIWSASMWTGADKTINEGTNHEADCKLLHHQSDPSIMTTGICTTLSAEDELDSICSSVEMLSLPDVRDSERVRGEVWMESDISEMLVL